MMKAEKIIAAATLGILIFSQLGLFAQAGPPGPGGGAPIDGGALTLVIGVAAYGYRKLKKEDERIKKQITYYESVVRDLKK